MRVSVRIKRNLGALLIANSGYLLVTVINRFYLTALIKIIVIIGKSGSVDRHVLRDDLQYTLKPEGF